MTLRTIQVLAGSARDGRCRYCSGRIVWVTVARDGRRPARTLPFDVPPPIPLSASITEAGLRFETWPRAALHSCRNGAAA